MDYGVKTNIGTRKINQDYFYKSKYIPLYIVADGMGGHNAGEIASKMSTEVIREYIEDNYEKLDSDKEVRNLIVESIRIANKKVYDRSLSDEELGGMGTTISLALIYNSKLYIGHVGDSSIFLIREDAIEKITEDHSLVEELYKKGSITKEEALNHPQKNVITRAVGSAKEIEVDIYVRELKTDDIIVIATDGLTNMVKKEEIREKILKEKDLERTSEDLVFLAKDRGGHDNITIMIIRI